MEVAAQLQDLFPEWTHPALRSAGLAEPERADDPHARLREGVTGAERFPYLVRRPKCGARIQADTASLTASDYRQHLDREHGMKREIVPLRHGR